MKVILCAAVDSVYKDFPDTDVWDVNRNAYLYAGSEKVICHPPCAQWSRLYRFAKEDDFEKGLAPFCWEVVNRNGGIFEHPYGSRFIKAMMATNPPGQFILVDQQAWGFPARKRSVLYFYKVRPGQIRLTFDVASKKVSDLDSRGARSKTTPEFARWLLDCL